MATMTSAAPTAKRACAGGAGLRWRCPTCRRLFVPGGESGARCVCGAAPADLPFADFIGGDRLLTDRVLAWPQEFIDRVLPAVASPELGESINDAFLAGLQRAGLVTDDGKLTRLGHKFAYNLAEHIWQTTKDGHARTDEQFESFMDQAACGRDSWVLDVGCGAAQTLRLLVARRPAVLAGVDLDPESLALACRLVAQEPVDFSFARATGDRLPVESDTFTHVICRVALNYMHQKRTLAEIVRVLRPGGHLFLRLERPWFDACVLVRSRRVSETLCRIRDLSWGVIHEVSGRQPTPGGRYVGARAFATARRTSAVLRSLGCTIVRVEASTRCPQIAGRSVQLSLLARAPH